MKKIWVKNYNKKSDFFFSEISKLEPSLVDEGDFNRAPCFVDVDSYLAIRKALLNLCLHAEDLAKTIKNQPGNTLVEAIFVLEAVNNAYTELENK